jgi:ribosomal protein L44E
MRPEEASMSTEPTAARTAAWHENATELHSEEEAAKHLTIGQVTDRTGLRQLTLLYAINRRNNPRAKATLRPLARPAYRFGNEPRWSKAQLDEYFANVERRARTFNEKYGDLPKVTAEQARTDQLVSLRALCRTSGRAVTTMQRWSQLEGFPEPAALLESNGPLPHLLRSWPQVRTWLLANRADITDLPERVPEEAWR